MRAKDCSLSRGFTMSSDVRVNGIAKTEQEQCQVLNSFSFHYDEGVESLNESCLSSALNRTKGDFA
ncbi:hypothetical protein NC653_004513 [Populus alba x Populus x berolinensis]|uniref:Uncharacterized protein n=1 Tax=Populus alba x Populus x berolinensis TaxID=444605 RepID=A0AAD6RU69_9ROSI|nr:hypothetical protein NC653_004513 [Populus alba x Populus x berolinensis]